MKLIIYWFRNDLRVKDNPGFFQACADGDCLLPIVINNPQNNEITEWGFERVGRHRRQFQLESYQDLKAILQTLGSDLYLCNGTTGEIFADLAAMYKDFVIYCQQIEAPEEKAEIQMLRELGIVVREFWQSSMLDPEALPFKLEQMPDVFTEFRKHVEASKLFYAVPFDAPTSLPRLPKILPDEPVITWDFNSSEILAFKGGARASETHIDQYFLRRLPDTYKQTRNQLMGMDFSSKFSPWLACGCCSARSIAHRLKMYEEKHGANDGTYWLWFELLWRDYFEFLPFKYGNRLFHGQGLTIKPAKAFNLRLFEQWSTGKTSNSFINAGMNELAETGFMSNRMRQIVASYWIYDMNGDWRAGAAWFESQLIDYDVYSNQGNWLYISGHGTDPRGGRPFNADKQAREYDPDGTYRSRWLNMTSRLI